MLEYVNLYAVLAATLVSVALGVIWDALPKGGFARAYYLMDTEQQLGARSPLRLVLCIGVHAFVFFAIAYGLVLARHAGVAGLSVLVMSSLLMLSSYVCALVWGRVSRSEVLVRGGYVLTMVWVGGLIMYFWPWN